MDKASAERDSNLRKFCASLDKDIIELNKELKEIKSQANVRLPAALCPSPRRGSIPPTAMMQPSSTSPLSFPPPIPLPLFNGSPEVSPRENVGIIGACR